jgi:hypothetical protein
VVTGTCVDRVIVAGSSVNAYLSSRTKIGGINLAKQLKL